MGIDLDRLRTLSAPLLSDVMDGLGLMQQAMRPFVRPVDEHAVLVGLARTGLYVPEYVVRAGENPSAVGVARADGLKQAGMGASSRNGPTDRIAPWGELL